MPGIFAFIGLPLKSFVRYDYDNTYVILMDG